LGHLSLNRLDEEETFHAISLTRGFDLLAGGTGGHLRRARAFGLPAQDIAGGGSRQYLRRQALFPEHALLLELFGRAALRQKRRDVSGVPLN
jgi:hypothetical protein